MGYFAKYRESLEKKALSREREAYKRDAAKATELANRVKLNRKIRQSKEERKQALAEIKASLSEVRGTTARRKATAKRRAALKKSFAKFAQQTAKVAGAVSSETRTGPKRKKTKLKVRYSTGTRVITRKVKGRTIRTSYPVRVRITPKQKKRKTTRTKKTTGYRDPLSLGNLF